MGGAGALDALERIARSERPEVWISLRDPAEILADAAGVRAELECGVGLPLAGVTVAVKDNIDVAGLPTTAACPAYTYHPVVDAPAVASLRGAGALVVGKTNLDQFATGLVGTRSPYGAVRDAWRPEYAAGGSSSGSAVAVALGLVDVALGTDTAGSGRVPAAFAGIIGLKPTRGLVGTAGVVPACRSLDCVSVFAANLATAAAALGTMAGTGKRRWPLDAPLGAPGSARIAIPDALPGLTPAAVAAFAAAAEALVAAGHEVQRIDIEPFLAAGRLLYGGGFVAERYAAVGEFITAHPDAVDPAVRQIILGAAGIPAHALARDQERLAVLRARAVAALEGADALLLPTTVAQPTIAAVAGDPIGAGAALGLYTNCANLLDLCALAVPAGEADGGRFGVTLLGHAFHDRVITDLAADLLGEERLGLTSGAAPPWTPLFVVGAHRQGQVLNPQLTARGGRLVGTVMTAPHYRMHRLETVPPKPGLIRVASGGVAVEGELWALPPAGFAAFVAALAAPMALGRVELADGSSPIGFLCEPVALEGSEDITAYGSWVRYLEAAV
jgi:allophanate hydrolase